jgi:hypothetical protein
MERPDGVVLVLPFFRQPGISPVGETLTRPSNKSLIILNSTSLSTLCGSSEAGSLPLFLTSSCLSASAVPAGTLAAQAAVLAHRIPAVNRERKVRACLWFHFLRLIVCFMTIRK